MIVHGYHSRTPNIRPTFIKVQILKKLPIKTKPTNVTHCQNVHFKIKKKTYNRLPIKSNVQTHATTPKKNTNLKQNGKNLRSSTAIRSNAGGIKYFDFEDEQRLVR